MLVHFDVFFMSAIAAELILSEAIICFIKKKQ